MASLHLRLPDDLDDYLTRSARQTRRSKNEIAAQMLEEARRVRQFPGIAYRDQHCITHSVLMRARNRTVRRIQAYHDLARKTIRMHSTGQEMPL